MRDFSNVKVGDTLYLVDRGRHTNIEKEVRVTKVGRIYFQIDLAWCENDKFYKESGNKKTEYHCSLRLYHSKEEYDLELERSTLSDKVKKVFSTYGILPFTLEQLREIDKIISKQQ